MPKAIWKSGILTRGTARLGKWGDTRRTVKQIVHDGDTVNVEAIGNIAVRFLGIDTPEVSFMYPETDDFKKINPHFKNYLTDPFNGFNDSAEYKQKLGQELINYLTPKLGPNCAENHDKHAEKAHRGLEKLIQDDETSTGASEYKFFLAFAYEIMDAYGRFLCFLHQDLPANQRQGKLSYNEDLLKLGLACPYFIFPNVNPFRKEPKMTDAIKPPAEFNAYINKEKRLTEIRDAVKTARNQNLGIFEQNEPLQLEPFELRYLSRRQPPSRYVIDLNQNPPKIKKPTHYHNIPHSEDRLFINPEHLCLFTERGYQIEN